MMRVVRRPKSGFADRGGNYGLFITSVSRAVVPSPSSVILAPLIRRLIRLRRRKKKVEERKKRQNKQNKYPSNYVALIYRSCFFILFFFSCFSASTVVAKKKHKQKHLKAQSAERSNAFSVNGFSCISPNDYIFFQHRFRACYQNGRRRRRCTNVFARNCSSAERNGLICSIL